MSHSLERATVPAEVRTAYAISEQSIRKIGGGMINATFRVTTWDNTPAILQQLGVMFGEDVIDDFEAVTAHMNHQGWEVPRLIPTLDGKRCVRDEQDNLWRAMTYIEHEQPTDEVLGSAAYSPIGTLLGRLHVTLSALDYEPKFKIPHFHDTSYHLSQLRMLTGNFPDKATNTMAAEVLENSTRLSRLPAVEVQLLHGDPRPANMLFKDKKPFTFIDLDTLMKGPIWLDIGDLLRSLVEDRVVHHQTLPSTTLRGVVDAYRHEVGLDIDSDEFFSSSLAAAKMIALELTARFLVDSIKPYFAFDSTLYPTRLAFDLERASLQRQIYYLFSEMEGIL